MKLFSHIILSILIPVAFGTIAAADEIDPFAEPPTSEDKQVIPKEFETTGGVKVAALTGQNPEIIPQDEWGWRNLEKIEKPTNFNRYFEIPSRIWKVDGGYFGAFDAGEWGGALFFAVDGATKWTRIINTHIKDLERYDYESDTFLATGGLAHLSLSRGTAYILSRLANGEWQARVAFRSDLGIPRVAGMSATDLLLKAESKRLIVLSLECPLGREPLFGVDVTGAVHYLGERANKKSSEQDGAGQPATRPEPKPEGGDKPQPEAEGRSR
jgi:hypothetical protein